MWLKTERFETHSVVTRLPIDAVTLDVRLKCTKRKYIVRKRNANMVFTLKCNDIDTNFMKKIVKFEVLPTYLENCLMCYCNENCKQILILKKS